MGAHVGRGYGERSIAASEAGKPAPAKPGTGLGGLGFGLAMLGLVPIGLGFVRMQDKARTSYTLGEGHEAAMHVPAATLPNGELFPLVSGTGDYALQFTAEMQGELTVDDTSVSLAALIASGRATQVGAAYSVPLAPGAQARVRHGALTFFIHSVAPGVVTARQSEIDKPFWVTNGGAFAVLGSLLTLTHLMPNDAGAALDLELAGVELGARGVGVADLGCGASGDEGHGGGLLNVALLRRYRQALTREVPRDARNC